MIKKLSLILTILSLSFSVIAQESFPEVTDHWLRAAPPNAKMLAAYGQLNNQTNTDKVLVGAFSPDFNMTEIHKTTIIEGIAKMIHQPELIIKSQQQLDFKPGGLHIMLMHPKKAINIGDKIKICLIYQQDDKTIVQHIFFPVEKR